MIAAIERFNERADLLSVLGVELRRVSSAHGGEWSGPCPLCRAGRDRLSVYPRHPGGARAACRHCHTGGDALTWAMALAGRDPRGKGEVGRYLRERGLLDKRSASLSRPRLRPSVPPPARVDQGEVLELWAASWPVLDAPPVCEFLARRRLNAADVEDLDLARALPPAGPLPEWALRGRLTWRESGHLLLVPLFDERGELRSLQARAVLNVEPSKLWPKGGGPRGLVFACPLGRLLLAGFAAVSEVLIAEGLTDFLTWATRWVDGALEAAPAVLGVVSGSWTAELAARIPAGARVILATDPDAAGDGYAERIAASLVDRCEVLRLRGVA